MQHRSSFPDMARFAIVLRSVWQETEDACEVDLPTYNFTPSELEQAYQYAQQFGLPEFLAGLARWLALDAADQCRMTSAGWLTLPLEKFLPQAEHYITTTSPDSKILKDYRTKYGER